jgi:hypothetical protein
MRRSNRRTDRLDQPGSTVDRSPRRAADLMLRDFVVIPAWITVHAGDDRRGTYPVVDACGAPVGIFDSRLLLERPELSGRAAADACVPLAGVRVVATHDLVEYGVASAAGNYTLPTLVLQGARLVGLLTRFA